MVTALKIASSSPSVATGVSGPDSTLTDALIWHKPSFSGGRGSCMSISTSLVAGSEEGGLEEFRLGVNSGTEEEEMEEDIEEGTDENGDERRVESEGSAFLIGVSFDVIEGVLLLTTLLNAAFAGNGGNMTSVGNP